jgi:hypothetical protein
MLLAAFPLLIWLPPMTKVSLGFRRVERERERSAKQPTAAAGMSTISTYVSVTDRLGEGLV